MSEQRQSIGALWEKTSQNGHRFYSGKIGDKSVVMFVNQYKTEEKHSTFQIYESEPMENTNG